jgi:hypothetical protein
MIMRFLTFPFLILALLLVSCSALPFQSQSVVVFGVPRYDIAKKSVLFLHGRDVLTHEGSHSLIVFVYRGGASPPKASEEAKVKDDYDAAEEAIFHAVEDAEKNILHAAERAEKAVEHVLEEEVETIFHDLPKHEEPVKAKEKVEKKKKKVVAKAKG